MRIAQRFDFRCAYCGHRGADQLEQGANTVANLLPACKPCNSDKRDLLLDEWATERERLGKPLRATSWAPEDRRYWHLTGMVKAPRAA
jgi:5-methylcytosine-specific restriction endonuclease McrA